MIFLYILIKSIKENITVVCTSTNAHWRPSFHCLSRMNSAMVSIRAVCFPDVHPGDMHREARLLYLAGVFFAELWTASSARWMAIALLVTIGSFGSLNDLGPLFTLWRRPSLGSSTYTSSSSYYFSSFSLSLKRLISGKAYSNTSSWCFLLRCFSNVFQFLNFWEQ